MTVPIVEDTMSQRNASGQDRRWTATDVPDQQGRTIVVTGANTGIGFETARVLAGRGATVVLACRDLGKAGDAAARIAAATPPARVETLRLDLASLASVRQAAEQLRRGHPRLDLLVNNAGVMMPPYGRTEDGFELQLEADLGAAVGRSGQHTSGLQPRLEA